MPIALNTCHPLARTLSISIALAWLIASCAGGLARASAPEDREDAARLVRHALEYEANGSADDRGYLLKWALTKVPLFESALWHSGYVREHGQWRHIDQVESNTGSSEAIATYRAARHRYPLTADGQVKLANYCARLKLPDAERAHLTQAVALDPDHAEARGRLGFVRVDGNWLSADELRAQIARRAEVNKARKKWDSKLRVIARGLDRPSARVRETALARLSAITDPAVIPAIEQIVARQSADAAVLAIEAISRIPSPESEAALIRQATSSPFDEARLAAVEKLRSLPEENSVPALLAALRTPMESKAELYVRTDGRLVYRHMLTSETQEHLQRMVLETDYRRRGSQISADQGARQRAVNMATAAKNDVERRVALDNASTEQWNERVSTVLAMVTSQDMATTPAGWWQWWNDHNEVFVEGLKPVQEFTSSTSLAVSDAPQMSLDCLAAGTPVWTEMGPEAVEKLRIGDRVLAQDIDTGELAYKPVLRTTVRPPEVLMKIQTTAEEIQASGGHPFWVSGQGWIKARNLQPGMRLHAPTGFVEVVGITPGARQPTYNLIVADFHNYCVGTGKLLSHDNTVRRPTRTIVPGWASK